MAGKNLGSLGEFALIDSIRQQAGSADHLLQGIGDDCAVQVQNVDQDLLTSTDLLIEGIHFERRWTTLEQLGRKAAAVNISDIAAMGGRPLSLFFAVGCPKTLLTDDMMDLCRGFLAEVTAHGAILAGGDTCASPGPLFLSVSVQGEVECGNAIYRRGAKPGDAIYVSGTLGDSALALTLLRGTAEVPEELLLRHHCPQPRVSLGRQLAQQRLASAMLDVSDGLLGDLAHILKDSEVGADLQLECLPLSEGFQHVLQKDPGLIDLALVGGEDYELLFTSAHQDLELHQGLQPPVRRIGQIREGQGVSLYRADGQQYQCARGGFEHFC